MADDTHAMVDDAKQIGKETYKSLKDLLEVLNDTDKSAVKRLGAMYSKKRKSWVIPKDHPNPSVFKDYLKEKGLGLPGREYITCAKEQKDEAKALGAKWDPIANSWYNPDGNEQGAALKEAFPLSTVEEFKAARAERRDYIDVDRADKDQAKAFGAKYDPGLGSWSIPVGCETAADLKATYALQSDERLYELQAERAKGKEAGLDQKSDRLYINVPVEEKAAAKALGAKWDGKAISWYIQRDNEFKAAVVTKWPEQSPEALQALQSKTVQAERAASKAAQPKTAQGRDYINVPQVEKDAAKALGAQWDRRAVSWYICSAPPKMNFLPPRMN